MRVRVVSKKGFLKVLILATLVAFVSQEALTQELASVAPHNFSLRQDCTSKNINLCYNNPEFSKNIVRGNGVTHRRIKRWLNGRPAVINIIVVNPNAEKFIIKPSYGSYKLNSVRRVKELVNFENAIAGINASYFKPDTGVPLGASIVNGEILTGPLYQRVVFGVTEDNSFKMEKIGVSGEIKVGNNISLPLFNINQPVFSQTGFTVYTDRWGSKTPRTSQYFCHMVVLNGKIQYIKQSSVSIPQGGYVVVGPRSKLPKNIRQNDKVNYTVKISPEGWSNVRYAVGGGPYLIKDGKIFIDRQHFSKGFFSMKAPRTAVGYTKSGNLLLVTVDGRQEGTSGATLPELAKLMSELGAYNAMNFDGGSSTQMVYKGNVVNSPTTRGGNRVTNALVIVPTL